MRALAAILLLVLAGCDQPAPLGQVVQTKPLHAGEFEVCFTAELLPAEDVARRCNFGVEPHDVIRAGCVFTEADPQILVAPIPDHANDHAAMAVIGHELLHVTHGDYHE